MKDATISVRIDSELKEQAEAILKQLDIPVSVLIDAMYRQVVIQQGLPFEITTKQRPKALDEYTKEEFDEMLEESCLQAQKGEVYPAEKVFIALKNLFIVSLPI